MIEMKLEDQERWLAQRKAELGLEGRDYVPVNNGSRRTPEKRALLQTIHDNARAQGREPSFYAVIGDPQP
jgi:hypothetical protein